MTSHVNGIVQATRRLLEVEAELLPLAATDPRRAEAEQRWQAISDERLALILAAIRDGVDDDLMRWAIDMQSAENRGLVDAVVAALTGAATGQAGDAPVVA